jgi:Amt family ammonium transporter
VTTRRLSPLLAALAALTLPLAARAEDAPRIDTGDTAWLLVSSAFVLFMTPGLALFYGGMVRRRNVLSTFMFVHFALAIITLQWVLVGYSLAFGRTHGGLIGGFDFVGLRGVVGRALRGTVPHLAFMAFQMKFAIITPALIAGAFVERMKFSAYVVFALLWTTLVYDPVAHWTWAEHGWLCASACSTSPAAPSSTSPRASAPSSAPSSSASATTIPARSTRRTTSR